MRLPIYQVDAFASRPFSGNPAAVVPLLEASHVQLETGLMQQIASENNLSETAFIMRSGAPASLEWPSLPEAEWRIRWFTPSIEVDLCGHATLASAFVILHHHVDSDSVSFASRSGMLRAYQRDGLVWLDFPADKTTPVADSSRDGEKLWEALIVGLGVPVLEVHRGRDDVLVVVKDAETVDSLKPDFRGLSELDTRGIIVTAVAEQPESGTPAAHGFVSRFFAPAVGVDEDPVTGSAHTTLTPFWAERLGATQLRARQLSARGGELTCVLHDDRVHIGGKVAAYMTGEISV